MAASGGEPSRVANPVFHGYDLSNLGSGGVARVTIAAGKVSGRVVDVPGMKPDSVLWSAVQHPSPTATSGPGVIDRTPAFSGMVKDGLVFSVSTDGGNPITGGGGDSLQIMWVDHGAL